VNGDNPVFNFRIVAVNSSNETPSPAPSLPDTQEYQNVSSIDGVTVAPFEGEATGFYVTQLVSNTTTIPSSSSSSRKRWHSRDLLNLLSRQLSQPDTSTPTSPLNSVAIMLPQSYTSQQLRFFNRGLPTEHYGFMLFFDKTIFLRTISGASADSDGENPLDDTGGVTPLEARYVCRLPETRYSVRIYTRNTTPDPENGNNTMLIVDPNSIQVLAGQVGGSGGATPADVDNIGGMAGYAVTIEEDRALTEGMTGQCWEVDERGNVDVSTVVNVPIVEGFNTGSGTSWTGCSCQWTNWKATNDGQ